MISTVLKRFTRLSVALLVAACTATPSTHFYILEATSQSPAPVSDPAKQRLIGIGPVTLPTLLERKQIVTRTGNNSIHQAEFHQWAAPLKDNLVQVLTQNLAAQQPNAIIRAYPWSAFGTVNYHIIIDITRFDTTPKQSANLEATWAIMNDQTHTLISNGHSRIEHPLTDASYAAAVDALGKTLGKFSRELSVALQQVYR